MTNYDQPVAPTGSYPAPPRRTYPLTGSAVAVQVLLVLQAVTAVLGIVGEVQQRSLIDRIANDPTSVSRQEAVDADGYIDTLNTAYLLLTVATGVVWIVWLYRARRNVQAWDAPFQRWGPGWTIGAWFIPIFNLFAPAMITKDIADGTDADPSDISGRRWPQSLVMWWGIAWALVLLTSAINRLQDGDLEDGYGFGATLRDLRTDITWSEVGIAVRLVAIVLAVALVRSLTRRQQERLATSPAA